MPLRSIKCCMTRAFAQVEKWNSVKPASSRQSAMENVSPAALVGLARCKCLPGAHLPFDLKPHILSAPSQPT
jgi:hypothetical protein